MISHFTLSPSNNLRACNQIQAFIDLKRRKFGLKHVSVGVNRRDSQRLNDERVLRH